MPVEPRFLVWRGVDAWRAEAAAVELAPDGLIARGTQLAAAPFVYRLDYRLDASDGFVTRSLSVTAAGHGWRRELDLRHDGAGAWSCSASASGAVDLAEPGGDPAAVARALDCDVGLSPLTNVMPIRRLGLNRGGDADLLMAWVSVPDLTLVASRQRYEHVRTTEEGSVVRFVALGDVEDFRADLELDADGFVIRYPQLAERVEDESARP